MRYRRGNPPGAARLDERQRRLHEPLGELRDLHGLAHVEHHDLAVVGDECAGLDHQLARLAVEDFHRGANVVEMIVRVRNEADPHDRFNVPDSFSRGDWQRTL